ncbi:MAG TPA: inorganic phosphate transporter [Alphaproteobacteria bacterium]|nr:inorganic phosphate transporter [Alphaproteobacteria bacterium]
MTSDTDALNGPATNTGSDPKAGVSPAADKSPDKSKPLKSLDKDLKGVGWLQKASREQASRLTGLSLSFLFLVLVWAFVEIYTGHVAGSGFVIVAAVIGGYMALNIGANDVANNVGPAVGSRALTMMGALLIAAVFESAGALVAGGDVVKTVSKGIIDPGAIGDARTFVWVMMAALLAAALWINLATYVGAPVSTTHSIVGAVMGAGITAAGVSAVNWPTMAKIAASWVISPVLGGVIAAAFLAFIKFMILFREDKLGAAKRWVPVLVGLMAGIFSMYLVTKGLKKIWKPDMSWVALFGLGVFAVTYAVVRPVVAKRALTLENRRKAVSSLFVIPLICSAALLSFAHGANDVANAVGPLAAIVHTTTTGSIATQVDIPIWVLLVGGLGISAGLFLFGPKLVRTVGEKITRLDPLRAFCVALSAAITVIVASGLGLPVSSTHIAVGGVFGVGFFRELHVNWLRDALERRKTRRTARGNPVPADEKALKRAKKVRRKKLVRRRHLVTIIAAWLVTVPAAAILSALIFLALQAFV